ncbi:MAG: MerR family transcriptional regulator [Endomicrobium sp.]|jgi:DNA-binding transcriptional MerR regulator|nr:MerR family transcriptional regulator [Endomicrobium sp.]
MCGKIIIDDKEYYNIGEASQITLVPKYTLRYWEKQFGLLGPVRKSNGIRKYSKEDIDAIFKIKELLYKKRYSIEGASKYLKGEKRRKLAEGQKEFDIDIEKTSDSKILRNIKEELRSIIKILKG